MKRSLRVSIFGLLALGSGVCGILVDDTSAGRLVESQAERSSVIGAGCLGQNDPLVMICSGGVNSNCTGCGCQSEHEGNNTDQGYKAPDANCNADPTCKYAFRRGSCTGE